MKILQIILIVITVAVIITVGALADAASGQTVEPSKDSVTEGATASPGGSDFRLQWYHYIIPAVLIFAMTFFTGRSMGPGTKK